MPDETTFYRTLLQEAERRQPFAVATVIAVQGSASARPGCKSLISGEGRNLYGWVGGGCVESHVAQNALEAIGDGRPRVISVDLNDEVLGVGMPCGGSMQIYLEPSLPAKRLVVLGSGQTARLVAQWSSALGFNAKIQATGPIRQKPDYVIQCPDVAQVADKPAGLIAKGLPLNATTPAEEALSLVARLLTVEGNYSGEPLWRIKQMPADTQPLPPPHARQSRLTLVGHNRMTEQLAALAVALDWDVAVNSVGAGQGDYPKPVCRVLDDDAYQLDEVSPQSYVVIATQHQGDHRVLQNILPRRPAYVGLIASRTRAELVTDFLKDEGLLDVARTCLHAPCGLDLGGHTPFEIAISILCEMISHRNANETSD
jgi:xanthine/CO dehydrogenase XdhC/CoxF family maturation factor